MLKALGPHRNARVILPIPDVEPIRPSKCQDSADEFRVCYTGNMFDYSEMLADLAQLALKQTGVRIEFRGRPRWPQALIREMTQRHLLAPHGNVFRDKAYRILAYRPASRHLGAGNICCGAVGKKK
jgi:hypothetical protein